MLEKLSFLTLISILVCFTLPIHCQEDNRISFNEPPIQRFRNTVLRPNQQQNEDMVSGRLPELSDPNYQQRTSNRVQQNVYNNRISNAPGYTRGQDNMNYRYAPPTQRLAPNELPYVITEERLRDVRSDFLYWFFDKGGNDDNGDLQTDIYDYNPSIHKHFGFQLPFFGFRFNYTRVSLHGYLGFSDPPGHYRNYPLKFPVRNWPRENDPSFIGIFYSQCSIGDMRPDEVDRRRPGVYFRMERDLEGRTDRFGVEMRERLKWDIREGVVGSDTFIPKHAVIVTWKNVSFSGGLGNAVFITNTFQLVLATDEVFTYAIFNYAEMQWNSHTRAGGDTTNGEGGVPAYVGFNAGNGTRSYEYYPYSQRSVIRDLVGRGWGNGFPGRHIFRIDENIMLGSCNKDISGTNLPLTFAPESGNMLGGTIVNITGPCFEPNMKVRCKFDTEEVVGRVVNRNRAVCVQPFLLVEGYVILDIAIGDGKFNWKGSYFVETPATAAEKISIESNKEEIHHTDTKQVITITWNKQNLTSNFDARLKLSVWGYRETTNKPELHYIDVLEDNIQNSGIYKIYPEVYANRYNDELLDLTFGFLRITITDPEKYFTHGLSPVLWSKPIPLGWYFVPQWERKYGRKWAERLCDDWLRHDRYLKNFAADIPQCPCVKEQALADKGRFLPDYDCDEDVNRNCMYNKGASHCVRTGAPSLGGSEQQCCYDKNNYLMLSYDQQWGSKPRRSHNLGYLPWNEANKVPTLSQWFHDISPFYTCCFWQEEQAVGCETFRFERRPTQDCIAYQSPYVATIFGDPHFITFDDFEYTFNGKGEFVLVHVDTNKHKLDVQARFEQVERNIYGPVMATQLTSVAAKDNSSATIEVRLRPPHAQWRYRLDVFANGKRIYFDRPSLKLQHFHGVTVYTPSYVLNQSEIVIMFESGVGVEVLENKGSMSARVYLPWQFVNQTKGLLGTWNFDRSDEFALPDGTYLGISPADFRSIHDNFGMAWILEDRDEKNKGAALFVREYGRTASYYANRTFTPEFGRYPQEIIPFNRTQDIINANNLCGDSYQCKYDYSVSLNQEIAINTLAFQNAFVNIKTRNKNRVISCGVLETPRFGRKSNFRYLPGTIVSFECNQDFVLIGDQKRYCLPEGRWDTPENGYTECLRLLEYELRTALISIALICIIMLPLMVLVCCVLQVCYRKAKKKGLKKPWQYSSAPALRRRSSVLALSSANLNDNMEYDGRRGRGNGSDDDDLNLREQEERSRSADTSSSEVAIHQDLISGSKSGKKSKKQYEGVYRTNEPLPGKPLIEFEEKVWDLDEEYRKANYIAKYGLSSHQPSTSGQQEYSSRTLWIVIPIILLIVGPLFLFFVCTGYRVLMSHFKSSNTTNRIIRNGSAEILADTAEVRQELRGG